TVLDRSEPALALGRELAGACTVDLAPPAAEWSVRSLTGADGAAPDGRHGGSGTGTGGGEELPAADLVTVSYVLGELPEREQTAVVGAAARAGRAVVVTEPGTPEGYARVIAARDLLVAAGLRVLAPCPHSAPCPMVPGEDWCHFAARVSRSSLHRQVKGGSLPYEDEKFSYVAAAYPEVAGGPAAGRIVRRPQKRKGQVLLELCTAENGLRPATVTKRHGADYRAARDVKWGDVWPPEV
ncbi:small ribosomal subunit Rsm22 family protein, partial [Streptomyces nanshensis]